MKFLNPLGFLLALLVPIIVVIHFKKHQSKDIKISSLKLWNDVIEEVKGIKSKRISRYLLLILQLLIGSLLVFLLAHPVISSKKEKLITIGIDTSVSMNSLEGGRTHFESAKNKCIEYINTLPNKTRIDVVSLSGESEIQLQNISKSQAIREIKLLKCTNEMLDLNNVNNILKNNTGSKIIFTDKNLKLGYKTIVVENAFNNAGITNANYDYYSNYAFCSVRNYSSKEMKVEIILSNEKGEKNIQSASVPADNEISIKWDNLWKNTQNLSFKIINKDALDIDNTFYLPTEKEYKKSVLLIGRNYFIEKALSSMPDINFTVKDDFDNNKYDLYIINKKTDMKVPKGNTWYTLPLDNMLEADIKGEGKVDLIKCPITDNIGEDNMYAAGCGQLKKNNGFQDVLKIGDKSIMQIAEKDGYKYLYSTIDFYKTDLPIKAAFPILIDNILNYMCSKDIKWYESGYCLSSNNIAKIQNQNGMDISFYKNIKLENPGIYKITDKNNRNSYIAINAPEEMVSGDNFQSHNESGQRNILYFDFKKIICLLLLALLVAEWEVYRNEI